MATTNFDTEKYDCNVSFALWQVKMKAILTQNRLQKALLEKDKLPTIITKEQKQELEEKSLATIQLCSPNEVLHEVIHEKIA